MRTFLKVKNKDLSEVIDEIKKKNNELNIIEVKTFFFFIFHAIKLLFL